MPLSLPSRTQTLTPWLALRPYSMSALFRSSVSLGSRAARARRPLGVVARTASLRCGGAPAAPPLPAASALLPPPLLAPPFLPLEAPRTPLGAVLAIAPVLGFDAGRRGTPARG